VATASFGMANDPYTLEKEFFMRVDVNSVRMDPRTRPALELHVVLDPKVRKPQKYFSRKKNNFFFNLNNTFFLKSKLSPNI
jgi:hypothetical protein